jgi:hypothetical protein
MQRLKFLIRNCGKIRLTEVYKAYIGQIVWLEMCGLIWLQILKLFSILELCTQSFTKQLHARQLISPVQKTHGAILIHLHQTLNKFCPLEEVVDIL